MLVSSIFFIFWSLFGEDFHFDEHIFQLGWNHQHPKKNTEYSKLFGWPELWWAWFASPQPSTILPEVSCCLNDGWKVICIPCDPSMVFLPRFDRTWLIFYIFFMVNVGKYTSPMVPMGMGMLLGASQQRDCQATRCVEIFHPKVMGVDNRWSFCSNYSDLTPEGSWGMRKGIPLIWGKSRLVKYFDLARKFMQLIQHSPWRNSFCFVIILQGRGSFAD